MKKWSRMLAVLAAMMLAVNWLPILGAQGLMRSASLARPQMMASSASSARPQMMASSGSMVFPQALRADLSRQFSSCRQTVTVSQYGLYYTESVVEALSDLIYYEMTEAFHVIDMYVNYYATSGLIVNFTVSYACSAKEYKEYLAECEAVAAKLLDGIRGNPKLTDVERALLVHDRLILHCEYDHEYATSDTELLEAFSMYGALAEGSAVCQGYTAAYDYLLEQLGMESRFCVSKELVHCWNIVNVNGTEYHVDTTWDDPTYSKWNLKGEVYHDFFLNSNGRCIELHETSDFDWIVSKTTYDRYFWQDSYSAFTLLGDEIYYIDHSDQTLRAYSDQRVLQSVADEWGDSERSYARLDTFGGDLYYNSADTIYELDLSGGVAEPIYTATLPTDQWLCGFTVEGQAAVYDIGTDPEIDPEIAPFAATRHSFTILPYTDIPDGAWYRAGVRYSYRRGLMNGMTLNTFEPETTMSRAMLVTVLYRLSGSPQVGGENSFDDVKEDQWFADAVKWAAQNGIVNGITPTTFEPNAPVNRAQMVTILYRYAQMQGFDTAAENDLRGFADRNAAPNWAKDALEWAVAEGIINGIADGGKTYLRYNDSANRAQVATVLMRYLKG